jgi:hypothetical protein
MMDFDKVMALGVALVMFGIFIVMIAAAYAIIVMVGQGGC